MARDERCLNGVAAMASRAARLIAWLAVSLAALPQSSRSETFAPVDYSKPLFTRRHAPLCESRDRLATLLALLRDDKREQADHVAGCTASPDGGLSVTILDRVAVQAGGTSDVWVRVAPRLGEPRQAFWTVGWMLRNDDTASIAGDAGSGRIKVCLTKAIDSDPSQAALVIPRLALFEDGGVLVGDLRDVWNKDTYRAETVDGHATIVTTGELGLSSDRPCGEVGARMLADGADSAFSWPASSNHVWDFDHVLGYPIAKLPQPNGLESIRGRLALRAVVVADVGKPLALSDAEAAKRESANPLGKIPHDARLARSVPANGPNGQGNFRICLTKDIAEADFDLVTISPNLLFESYGRLVGDLRDPWIEADNRIGDPGLTFAVVTQTTLTLSKTSPCGLTSVRSVLSRESTWLFPLIRESDHLRFRALTVAGHTGGQSTASHLGDALGRGMLNATPVSDIGHPIVLDGTTP